MDKTNSPSQAPAASSPGPQAVQGAPGKRPLTNRMPLGGAAQAATGPQGSAADSPGQRSGTADPPSVRPIHEWMDDPWMLAASGFVGEDSGRYSANELGASPGQQGLGRGNGEGDGGEGGTVEGEGAASADGGRPLPPAGVQSVWGTQLGDCHGVAIYSNKEENAETRQAIAQHYGWTEGNLRNAYPGEYAGGLGVIWNGGYAYQCAEFVRRYCLAKYGTGLGPGDAKTLLDGTRGGFERHVFPCPTKPQAGDILITQTGNFGHVGIVKSVNKSGNVIVAEQNWSGSWDGDGTRSAGTLASGDGGKTWSLAGWSGFRRFPGTAPPEGEANPSIADAETGEVDTGRVEKYRVPDGWSLSLNALAAMFDTTVDHLRMLNPGIGAQVEGGTEVTLEGEPPPMDLLGRTPHAWAEISSNQSLNLRSRPNSERPNPLTSLPNGTIVAVVSEQPSPDEVAGTGYMFVEIVTWGGITGWLLQSGLRYLEGQPESVTLLEPVESTATGEQDRNR